MFNPRSFFESERIGKASCVRVEAKFEFVPLGQLRAPERCAYCLDFVGEVLMNTLKSFWLFNID